jgi:glycosyltransferase involved in cell wall biosynthesis
MRILILSFYYPPDIGPGALRAKSIVDSLIKEGPSDLKVDVITTMPNRYQSLNVSALKFEEFSKVSINRITIPIHKNGIFDQVKAFIYFSLNTQKLIFKKKWDIIIATSARLMTASLAVWIAKHTKSKIYLDIRDLFTDTIEDVFKNNYIRIFLWLFCKLEKWTFQSANMLNIVSPGFLEYIKKIAPHIPISTFTNGVDEIFLKKDFLREQVRAKPLILFTGNIGDGQGLHKILPKASNELKDIQFRLIGDGSALKLLINNDKFNQQNNIEVLKPILRDKLLNEYQKADILFLHLNNYKAFQKVLPSKIFEYASTGKPILAGVSGYAAKFLSENIKGVEIFNPCDVDSMKVGLRKLLNGPRFIERSDYCFQYSRKKIMQNLAKEILSLSQ